MADKRKSQRAVQAKVSVDLQELREDEEAPKLAAYAFTHGGEPVGYALLEGRSATLTIDFPVEAPAGEERPVRVLIGPAPPTGEAKRKGEELTHRDLADLSRVGAAEQVLRLTPGGKPVDARFIVLRPDWLCWLRGLCTVRGTLLKRVERDGVPVDMPVCGAEVEVYEVDPVPILVSRIPRDVLERLRHLVRVYPKPKFPPPPPEDGPFGPLPPEPGPEFDVLRELLATARQAVPGSRALSTGAGGDFVSRAELAQLAEERFARHRAEAGLEAEARKAAPSEAGEARTMAVGPEPVEAPSLDQAIGAVAALAETQAVVLAAGQGTTAFRDALVGHPELIRPLICLLFPRLVTKRLVATAETGECGRFSAIFWRGCDSDTPDLYFVAYRRFLSWRIPIYQPLPVSCHTYWNYACGSEVTLYTSSPFATTCPPCRPVVAAPRWVLVMTIGHTPLSRIHGTGAALTTTPENVGLTDWGAPFGGLLRPGLEFDSALRDIGVRYYRVSWKKAGSGNPWLPLEGEVHRHFKHESEPGPGYVIEVYPLGPRVVGGTSALYEIPPALPPKGSWSVPDQVEDTASAKFPTGGSQPGTYGLVPPGSEGMYKLRVELFDEEGKPVDIARKDIHFVVPTSTDLSGTIETVEAATLGLVPGPPVDTGNAFVMRLHIDNNPTTASIAPPLLNGSVGPDPKCGVIEYPPDGSGTVTIAYKAFHPHGFATYEFLFVRGANPLTPPSAGGAVGSGSFSEAPAVGSLLEGCTVAGFAERLDVYGTATDGWSRQGYDAHDLRAFVLKPGP